MGKFIKIKASQIKPSQNFVKEKTVRFILECISKKELDKLPPTPIVRKNQMGSEYIAIDGHNLIVIYDLLDKEFEVYLANSADDKLKEESGSTNDAVNLRNKNLKEKYDLVLENIKTLEKEKILSFKDLRNKYSFLNSLESANKYYNIS